MIKFVLFFKITSFGTTKHLHALEAIHFFFNKTFLALTKFDLKQKVDF